MVEGRHPMAQDDTKDHGLKDPVQPGQGDSVVGMVGTQAKQEPQNTPVVQVLGSWQDCRSPVNDGVALDGAVLGHREDTGKDKKKAGNKHFVQDHTQ